VGVPSFSEGRTLPVLQDTDETQLWARWEVTYRDVRVLDASGAVHGVYNLTEHDLSDPANVAELQAVLEGARD
jgi:hypothetical protein